MTQSNLKFPEDLLIGLQSGESIPLLREEKGINATSVGMVKTEKEYVRAYIKKIPLREVLVETLCALLGRRLGLPIPRPIWVFQNDETENFLFGSEDLSYPSHKKFLKIKALPDSQKDQILENWKHYRHAICFDEWIANTDRHTGNILIDQNFEIFLIDHGLSIPENFSPTILSKNQLATSISKGKDEIFLQNLRKDLMETVNKFESSYIPTFPSDYGPPIDSLIKSTSEFLLLRLPCLQDLIKQLVRPRQGEIPC
ncbi:MAG: HipA family kinase [Leptospirillum sp.]